MNFIESTFHISPDNGTGAIELLLLAILLAAPLLFARFRSKLKRPA